MAKRRMDKRKSEEEISLQQKKEKRNKIMALSTIIFVVTLLILTSVLYDPPPTSDENPQINLKAGQNAPVFSFTDVDSSSYDLSGFLGRAVILNMIDTNFCEDCLTQMGYLKTIYLEYQNNDVVIISIDVNTSGSNEQLNQYRTQFEGEWIFAKDPGNAREEYGVKEVPTTFIIDKKGKIAYPNLGLTSSASFFSLIESLDNIGNKVGQIAPNFTLNDIDGNKFSLSDYRGQVIVIDLMATWCGPCKTEMAHLKEIFSKYDHNDVWIMSIDVDNAETVSQLREFKNEYGSDWTFATQGSSVGTAYGVTGIPQMYIIDQDGIVAYKNTGVTSSGELSSEIDKLL
jgi:peroxiredoxin